MAIKCPRCKFDNPTDTHFCGNCAALLHPSKENSVSQTETLKIPIRELNAGSIFAGRYQIIEELGKGGMGKVYRVLDKKLKEEVGLKLIKPEIATDKETIERFSNELKLARKIAHRNVGKMYELMEAEGTHFITMEYVPGQDLRALIRQTGRLTTGKAVSVARQVCEGLAEAHRLGVVHRDLKPGNIMIDKEGNAKIVDFGIARSISVKGITGAGVMIGTPEYLSPEQVEGKEVDKRSDIYSLGIILYEMLTGQVPFEGDTPFAVGVKHKSETPKDPRELNAQIPDELGRVILKCLEKAKEKRYQGAGELSSELAKIEEEFPTTERAMPKRNPPKSREIAIGEGKIKWNKIALYGGAVVLLALIAYAGLHLFTSRKEVIDSIAVPPFENVNADPNTDFLCDGITETIINKLSQLSNLRKVISRNSVFTYKGKTLDPKNVGQELGVKAVLLTRLGRVGDRLTIGPTLVRTRDNSQLWGERYNRKFDDIMAIEEEMATSIIQALQLKLSGEDKRRLSERPIDDVAAYQCYLKANAEIMRFSESSLDSACLHLQKGLDILGDNALLYSTMAAVYWQYANIGAGQEDHIAKAEEYVQMALALDPDSPQAHFIIEMIKGAFYGNVREAVRQLKMALAVNQNYVDALKFLAGLYTMSLGKLAAAIPLVQRVKQIDPLDPWNYWLQGRLFFYDGQYKLALEQSYKFYRSDPENTVAQFFYALTLTYEKELDEAFSIIDRSAKMTPANVFTKFGLLLKYGLQKDREKALREMTPDFLKTCKRDHQWSYFVAIMLALNDAREEVLDWLENAVNGGFINYPELKQDPYLDNLRGEERFKKLMERVKYEWEHFEV